jgi:hypothetical protein
MITINTAVFTEKNAVKPAVRTAILEKELPLVADQLASMGFKFNAEKKAFTLEIQGTDNKPIFLSLTATVGKNPADKAAKKPAKHKASVAEVITISND